MPSERTSLMAYSDKRITDEGIDLMNSKRDDTITIRSDLRSVSVCRSGISLGVVIIEPHERSPLCDGSSSITGNLRNLNKVKCNNTIALRMSYGFIRMCDRHIRSGIVIAVPLKRSPVAVVRCSIVFKLRPFNEMQCNDTIATCY